jgi:S-DNA-T family DNA segregation ATPase FtsK/SpoIIIE
MGRKRKRKPIKLILKKETMFSLASIVLIVFGVLVMISFSRQGVILAGINSYLIREFGISMLFLPFVFIASGMVLFQTEWLWSKPHVLLGTILMMVGFMGATKSGAVGVQTATSLSSLISPYGAMAIFVAFILAGVFIMLQLSVAEVLEFLHAITPKAKFKPMTLEEQAAQQSLPAKNSGFNMPKLNLGFNVNDANKKNTKSAKSGDKEEDPGTAVPVSDDKKKPTANAADIMNGGLSKMGAVGPDDPNFVWEYPPLSLLSDKVGGEANRGDVKANAEIIERTLGSFGIKARVVEVNYGPAVTQYALEIALGTKLSKITGLATDLALALAAPTGQIRIEAPIAGRALVGVEVPNYSAQFVTLRTMLTADKMKKNPSKLAVALGLNVSGEEIIADIAKMPHVLIAGSTGSGKSVAINTFMCSMLFRASPAEVKFILVDPKRVELTGYNDIPHLLTPVIVEPKKVVSALKWATAEMDRRYKQLAEVGVKNLDAYNELAGFQALPSIVIIIDELADIMLFAPAEVEESVTRIAQMARAVGIHLVLATQRPSVDVITGLIKANIPTRIAFNVSSMMDSRVILDSPGAEKLLGKGDMLYVPPEQAKPSRIQGTFVSEPEIKRLVEFIKAQGQKPKYEEDITTKYQANTIKGGSGGTGGEDRDALFDESVKLFSQYDKASSSLIQRRLSVGYARAARILDQLYEAGFVGPAEGSKPRDVNLTKVREYLSTPRE